MFFVLSSEFYFIHVVLFELLQFSSKLINRSVYQKNRLSINEPRKRAKTSLNMGIDSILVVGYGIILPMDRWCEPEESVAEQIEDGIELKEFNNLQLSVIYGMNEVAVFLAIKSTCQYQYGLYSGLDISKIVRPSSAEVEQFKLFLKWSKKELKKDYGDSPTTEPSHYAFHYLN
jgi:hypothetical protein